MGRYWLVVGGIWSVLGGTGSVWGCTGWYLVELGQYWAGLAGTLRYLVSKTQYCLVLGCIGSVKCLDACIC